MFLCKYIQENKFMDTCMSDIENILYESNNYIAELELMEIEDNLNLYFNEARNDENDEKKQGIVTKIGNGVIAIFQKIKTMLSHFAAWVADKIGGLYNKLNRAEKIMAKDPSITKEVHDLIIEGVKNGDLNIRDASDLNKFLKESKGLIDQINSGKLNPDKADSMFEKILNAFESGTAQRTIGALSTIVGVASTVVGLKKAINELQNNSRKLCNEKMLDNLQLSKMKVEEGSAKYNAIMNIAGKASAAVNKRCGQDRKSVQFIDKILNKVINSANAANTKYKIKHQKEYDKTAKTLEERNKLKEQFTQSNNQNNNNAGIRNNGGKDRKGKKGSNH